MKKCLIVSFVSLFSQGCRKVPSEPLVAQYKDRYLTRAEALSRMVIPAGADTAFILHSYGAEWIKQQALADTAYALLPRLRNQIEAQVQEYRAKLLIAHLSRLLAERAVGYILPFDSALRHQYEENPQAFRAIQPFYQCRWVKLPNTWLTRRELAQKLVQPDSVWRQWLRERGYKGEAHSDWVPKSQIDSLQMFFTTPLTGLPLRGVAQASQVEGGQAYLLVFQLTGLILPGQTLPFELVRERLRTILIQQRIHEWLSAFEDSIYRQALARPDVHLY
ncbi:MAG: hypothetical protein RMJ66_06720 [Bacteroidia bacterium]|nr:hypothetical protein [Bacteroidia bacterium]MDW8134745.1 hypothetical protein [Bacteroidia bacterium]